MDINQSSTLGLSLVIAQAVINSLRWSMETHQRDLLKLHNINHLPNPLNLHHNLIPILEPNRRLHPKPNTTGSARHNQTPRLQRLPRTQETHQLPNPKHQIPRIALLPLLPIHKRPQRQPARIPQQFRRRNTRPQRRVLVEALAETPLRHHAGFVFVHLPVAAADVVAGGVARDVREGVGFGDVFGVGADDDGQLAFVVAFGLAEGGDGDRGAGVGYSVGGFDEEGWVGGDVEAGFEDCGGGRRVLVSVRMGRRED